MAEPAQIRADVTAWVLSGGQSLRMGGQDKGLVPWRGRPLAWHVATLLSSQVSQVCINANRHLPSYGSWPWPVYTDDAVWPTGEGPLVGICTGLAHCTTPWLQLAPCDSPELPADLVYRLLLAAQQKGLEIAVPVTDDTPAGSPKSDALQPSRHHWTTALVSRTCLQGLQHALTMGERRVGRWVSSQRWGTVAFADKHAFLNINTPDDLGCQR